MTGAELRRWLTDHGITQTALAQAMGLPPSAVARLCSAPSMTDRMDARVRKAQVKAAQRQVKLLQARLDKAKEAAQ